MQPGHAPERAKQVMNFCRFFDSKTKTIIVLEGLAGRPIQEICQEYNIREEEYRWWRKVFLQNSPKVFDWDFEDRCMDGGMQSRG
jgi:hypothetical protein